MVTRLAAVIAALVVVVYSGCCHHGCGNCCRRGFSHCGGGCTASAHCHDEGCSTCGGGCTASAHCHDEGCSTCGGAQEAGGCSTCGGAVHYEHEQFHAVPMAPIYEYGEEGTQLEPVPGDDMERAPVPRSDMETVPPPPEELRSNGAAVRETTNTVKQTSGQTPRTTTRWRAAKRRGSHGPRFLSF